MKKKIVAVLLAVSIVTGGTMPVFAESKTQTETNIETEEVSITEIEPEDWYATVSLNVRSQPDTDGTVLDTLYSGEKVSVIAKCSNGWFKIEYDDEDAYVSGKYMTDEEPQRDPVISADSDISTERYSHVVEYYNMIPENVRNHYEASGWKVRIVSGLGPMFGYSSVMGLTDLETDMTYVDNRDVAETAILHEMGHYIDLACGWPSDSSEFANIRAAEVNSLLSFWNTNANNVNTCREYFAEIYEASITNTDEVKEYCPQSYEFVMRYSDSL